MMAVVRIEFGPVPQAEPNTASSVPSCVVAAWIGVAVARRPLSA